MIAIIMGSKSDLTVMNEAMALLDSLEVSYKAEVVSAHRTPKHLYDFSVNAKDNGFKVIIAGAGGAAHLPGMVASLTTLPVIGVPVKSSNLSGVDSLYSIVQMPPGIPVGTMAINGAKNAALYALSILGIHDDEISEKLLKFKEDQTKEVFDNREIK